MQIKREIISPTKLKLDITADKKSLDDIKAVVIEKLGQDVKVAGFRPGNAPAHLIEKQVDPQLLQSEFLNDAVSMLYEYALRTEKIRSVDQPQVSITKFVPFDTLEFSAEVEVIGDIKLGDYKNIKLAPKTSTVSASEINNVIDNLRDRSAQRSDVKRAAKLKDEVVIDFSGVDAKTKEPIAGADGTDYPLTLGSNSFIPGFEEELVGLKSGETKTFKITFPADYGAKALQNKPVNFTVTVKSVKELSKATLDDKFAATVGPFQSVNELKADIKKQLLNEKNIQNEREIENELLTKLADKSEVAVPDSLIDQEAGRLEEEEKRNLVYRGQTWQEHLTEEGVTAEEHHARQKPIAETRIKTGILLGEIAEKEKIEVSQLELANRIVELKEQYTDQAMQSELDSEEGKRDIHGRLMIEKTINRLRELNKSTKK